MDFDYSELEALLCRIAAGGYTFLRFDAAGEKHPDKRFFLRHDVDLSARAAARVGEVEASHGIVANFFFQIGTETYNIFSPGVLDTMRSLRRLGHAVGLHLDREMFSDHDTGPRRAVEWFSECVCEIDRVVSFHRPSESVLERSFDGFVSAYEARFFTRDSYLSDSRRNVDFHDRLSAWMDEGRSPIQLLLHPGWWYAEPDMRKFKDMLVRRRASEVERYLADHMGKAFGRVIDDEDSPSGL